MSEKNKNIYEKIMTVRQKIKNSDIKKSGKNTFQNYDYHELSDFVPLAIDFCKEEGLYTHIDIGITLDNDDWNEYSKLTVINIDNVNEKVEYLIKMPTINNEQGFNAKIQDTGKGQTYIRRYLYMLFLDLAVADEVDSVDNSKKTSSKTVRKSYSKKTPTRR